MLSLVLPYALESWDRNQPHPFGRLRVIPALSSYTEGEKNDRIKEEGQGRRSALS